WYACGERMAPLLSDPAPIARVADLVVRYGPRTVLDRFSLDIPEGCVGLLGPNGAGKTTLIKTLLGFVHPAAGTAEVLGYDVATQGPAIRQRIGLMPEQDCHIPGMNAVTFVAYAGELAGMPAAQALRRAHEVLEYCGLGEARYRNVETYSTGMKQRIKLAQALVHGPRLVFLDEPTNGLDPEGRDAMLALVKDVSHGKGLSVVVSSHLLPDIERTCDSAIVLRRGEVVRQGPIADLRATGGTRMEVDLRAHDERFVAAMADRGGVLEHRQGSHLRFAFDGDPDPAKLGSTILEAARESGVQVRAFRAALRSLEDVFLEAIGETDEGSGK
ncbi:MAG: ATP-binding cassette domain-containing protein, partial [Armatimonadota bacterium]